MSRELSVIIATYKRPALLARCLRALVNQSLHCGQYEIIVVSDGPDEETVKAVNDVKAQYLLCPAIHSFSLNSKKGPAAARNLGWQQAKGKLIVFTDDDCVPLFYWLQFYRNAYIEYRQEEIAFAGKVKVPLPANAQKRHWKELVDSMRISQWHGVRIAPLNLTYLKIIFQS